jgi:hypothetical protein
MPVVSCRLICVLTLVFSAASHAANITVSNLNDAGPGSLRQAVDDLNFNQEAGNTIDFSVTGTILLTTGSIDVFRELTINGPAGGIIIDGSNNNQQPECLVSSAGIFFVVTEGNFDFVINDLTIQNGNSGQQQGGGAIFANFSDVVANRCTFLNNTGNRGGAIFGAAAAVTLTNCTFDGNTAPGGGEAVYVEAFFQGPFSLTVTNCTSTDTMVAGFLEVAVPFTIRNSIVTASIAGDTVNENNLIGNNPDPLLGALANNGGPTRTFALQSGSPAINAGVAGAGVPAIDQRGIARDAQVDIGSFEFVPLPPVINSVTIPESVNECGTVVIVVNATDPQGAPITITYDYGDGSSPDSTGSHVYCTPGTFTVTVTVTSMSGTTTSTSQLTVIPQSVVPNPTPASLKFRVIRGIIKFAGAADTVSMQGILHIPANFTPAGKVILVKIGTIERSFTLDAKGAGTSGSDTFALRAARLRPKAYEGRFKAELSGDFVTGSPEQLVVQITFLDKALTNKAVLKYSKGNSSLAKFTGAGID